jgi:amino acid adenylation domain-containing protein
VKNKKFSERIAVAASQKIKEKEYWLNKLSGELTTTNFPYDYKEPIGKSPGIDVPDLGTVNFKFDKDIFPRLMKMSKGNDYTLNVILQAGLVTLLGKYKGKRDIIVGAPIYKQDIQADYINTVLPLRNYLPGGLTFKELLSQVKQTLIEATENRNYPVEILPDQLNMLDEGNKSSLFDIAILLENIHDKKDLGHHHPSMIFSFSRTAEALTGRVEYNSKRFEKTAVEKVIVYFMNIFPEVLFNVDVKISNIDILPAEEKIQLIYDFNNTRVEYPKDKTIPGLFEEQVSKNRHKTTVVYEDKQLTYKELNEKANRLARVLKLKGVKPDMLVGILMEDLVEMVIAVLAVLKAGGAYLPIDAEAPANRILSMLEECNVSILLTGTRMAKRDFFTVIQDIRSIRVEPQVTSVRPNIKDFNRMPIPARDLVDYEKFNQYIDLTLVKNCLSIQGTRGCPYHCAYCHKIWPKTHVVRSAEHIFSEVELYYRMGVRRFAFIDDIFNLDKKNSTRFFQLIIQNGLDVQLFFSGGLRGDLLTADYIDLMIEAGTAYIALALETASPRLQKLIGKNLNIEKFKENLDYICEKYPGVIIALFVMLGFPTETEAEAMKTYDFIKSTKWIHFPYINVLVIYPNTDMARLALENGVTNQAIINSENAAYHDLPDTLPFEKSFASRFQTNFFNEYFLSRERLLQVLPHQMKIMTEEEIVKKYNSYLPNDISDFQGLLEFIRIDKNELSTKHCLDEECMLAPDLNEKMRRHFRRKEPGEDAINILLLDLSQSFTWESHPTNDLVEPPLGPMYLMAYLYEQLQGKINGKIAKALVDFDNYRELKQVVEEFKPHIIGLRTLSFYKDFFHRTAAIIRQWYPEVPIIAGGPYATSSYRNILQDRNIDLIVLGEGEITFCELVEKFLENDKKLPDESVLKEIAGIAFVPGNRNDNKFAREILIMDEITGMTVEQSEKNLRPINRPTDLAYAIFTSGSTGKPKATIVEQMNVVRLVKNNNFVQLEAGDRLLQTGALEFDASTFEIWGALLNGLELFLADKDKILIAEELKLLIEKYEINTMWLTSPLFNQLLQTDIEIFRGLKNLLVGGDVLSPFHINRLRARFPRLNVINGYGPTENTTFSTTHLIHKKYDDNIPIGNPIANSTVYIIDSAGDLTPGGAPGELCVGGDGVARGYLNNPELTAQRFVKNSFLTDGRLYKTGDLARWLPDKNIEFIGRIDQQVKIRGIRIELGEIENQLLTHDKIEDAVVIINENHEGDRRICAYFAANSELNISGLKFYLAKELPDYMIPVHFVQLPKLPLTPNGKVDKKLLPTPGITIADDYVAPRNRLEKKLVKVWSEVLAIEGSIIGIDTDFFELGGHSLNATVLVSKLHKELNVKVPLTEIFQTPTIRGLSRYLSGAAADQFVSIENVEEKEYYVLSSAQERMYVMQQMDPESTTYNLPQVMVWEGEAERKKLENTFKKLITRHESLRTSFHLIHNTPVQKIHRPHEIDFIIDYYKTGDEEAKSVVKGFVKAFPIDRAPQLRVGLITVKEKRHVLMVDMHHIISDGMSNSILVQDFFSLYQEKELSPLKLQYKDYSWWQKAVFEKEGEIKRQEEYWLNVFAGEVPILDLPADYPRPAVKSDEGDILHFQVAGEEFDALKKMAREKGVTLFMVLLAVYNILLSKLSGQEDIVIGSGIAGRRHADLRRVIGMFVNVLALRNFPGGEKSFARFLEEVKEQTLQAFDNQDYQFEDLVGKLLIDRDPSRTPLCTVGFELQNITIDRPGLNLKAYEFENRISKADMTLFAVEAGENLRLSVEYCTKLFKKETIQRFIKYFMEILSCVIENENSLLQDIEISHELFDQKLNIPGESTGDFVF